MIDEVSVYIDFAFGSSSTCVLQEPVLRCTVVIAAHIMETATRLV